MITHSTLLEGDEARCLSHIGYARGVLRQMVNNNNPAVKSKHLFVDDVEIWVTKQPNSIKIKAGKPGLLFCTSFNAGVDDGTQIYKSPFPPYTEGGLIGAGDNPTALPLPSATYKARTNYWVDNKEKNTVSWEYITTISPLSNKKYGKIAIQGIESDQTWGLFLEPLCCGLISDSQLAIIYRNRVNYTGSGTTRYFAVYNYILDFANKKITLSLVSRFALPTIYNNYFIAGMLNDCKTIIYTSGNLFYFTVSNDFLTITSSGNLIWQSQPTATYSNDVVSSDPFNYITISTLQAPTENRAGAIDVRGDVVSFCIQRLKTRVFLQNTFLNDTGDVWLKRYDDREYDYITASWSLANGFSQKIFKSTIYSDHIDGEKFYDGGDWVSRLTTVKNVEDVLMYFYAAKINSVCYKHYEYQQLITGRIHLGGSFYNNFDTVSTETGTNTIKINEIAVETGSYSDYWIMTDVAYTEECIIASYSDATDVSVVINLKNKKHNVVNTELKTLSVTALPLPLPT